MDHICSSCGKAHNSLAVAIPVTLPTQATMIPPRMRSKRVWTNDEMCAIDGEHFYVYGSIPLKIHEHTGDFTWGAWAKVDEETFLWFDDHLETAGREAHEPFFGTLGTDIPFYSCTLGMPHNTNRATRLSAALHPESCRPRFGPRSRTGGLTGPRTAVQGLV